MAGYKDNTKQILVKLIEMSRHNAEEVERLNLMIQELSENYMQLNYLTLGLAKNTHANFQTVTRRLIDLETANGIIVDEGIVTMPEDPTLDEG